jgi:hypothetical protein
MFESRRIFLACVFLVVGCGANDARGTADEEVDVVTDADVFGQTVEITVARGDALQGESPRAFVYDHPIWGYDVVNGENQPDDLKLLAFADTVRKVRLAAPDAEGEQWSAYRRLATLCYRRADTVDGKPVLFPIDSSGPWNQWGRRYAADPNGTRRIFYQWWGWMKFECQRRNDGIENEDAYVNERATFRS